MIQFYAYIFISTILVGYNSNIAVLKFKTFYPFITNQKENLKNKIDFNNIDFLNSIHLSKIYLELEIGNEMDYTKNTNQTLNTIIDMNQRYLVSTDLYFKNPISFNNYFLCNYNISLSSSFKEKKIPLLLTSQKPLACQGEETFKIYSNNFLNKYNFIRMGFIIDLCHKETNLCGNIGLDKSYFNFKNYYFLPQIYKALNISEFSWTLIYSNNKKDEGIFIFGDIPQNYLEDINKDKNNTIKIYSKNLKWEILIDEIIIEGYNNLNLIRENEFFRVDISPEIEGLEFHAKYFDELYNIFFKKYIDRNICKIKNTNETYIIIYCDAFRFGKNDINKFPRIIFNKFKNGLKFYFNGEDLFYYNNNKYFFMIIKNLSYQNKFTLGRLFLKK